MKKIAVFLVLVSLVVPAALFASGSQSEQASGPITLTIWTHEDANRTRIEERYINEFMTANPNIKVERVTQSSGKMKELVQTAFAANQGPDIFNLPIEQEYPYIANGRVAPINYQAAGYKNMADLLNAYDRSFLEPVIVGNNVYGLPLEITNWCVYINKKVFRSAGLDPDKDYPKTWEDMVAVSEKLVIRNGNIITRRGYDFRYPYYLTDFIPMVEQLGGKLVSDDKKTAIVGDQAWLKFLQFMKDWGPSGKNLGSPTYTAVRSLFNADNNDVAMASTGLYQQARIKSDNPAFFNSNEWMVVPYPKFANAVKDVASCFYGHYYMVNAQSSKANQEAAWKLIGFLLSHSEDYLREAALVQPTKALLNSPTYKSMPYSDVFTKDMQRAHIVYYGANSTELEDLIKAAVDSVMLAGETPDRALATLKKAAQELIDNK